MFLIFASMHRLLPLQILLTLFITLNLLFTPHITQSQTAKFDEVLKTIVYKQDGNEYLILHESMYQTKSQSYSKGNIRSSGYNFTRISVYNINNGRLVIQKEMGAVDSAEACLVLGCTDDNLWIYSKKYRSGLQSLHPLTLEKNVSQATIYKNLKQGIGLFIEPVFQELDKNYGFDPIQQKLIITNELNQKYYIDLEIFTTEKINESVNLKFFWKNYLRSAAYFCDSLWKMDGFDKMVLVGNTVKTIEPEFLNGLFIMEQNPVNLFKHYIQLQEQLSSQLSYPEDNQNMPDLDKKTKLELKLNYTKNNITFILKGTKPDDVLLQPAQKSFFVWSRENEAMESVAKVSRVTSTEYGKFTIDWETPIPGMFFNISTARNTNRFKNQFGDFIPQSDFVQFELVNQRILILYLGQICCLNTETGVVEWAFYIK
jgi:hypothetical protein